MIRKITFSIFTAALLIGFVGCNKFDNDNNDDPSTKDGMEQLIVNSSFDWQTSKEINIKITAKDNNGTPLQNVRFSLYTNEPEDGGRLIFSGVTGNNGIFEREYEIPSYYDSLVIATDFIGLPSMVSVPVTENGVDFTFGGSTKVGTFKSLHSPQSDGKGFVFLGGYDSQGAPDYLEVTNDPIDQDFLDDVNNTLPERVRLPEGHPSYFDNSNKHNLALLETADVWVTFVHEGAGWKNVLGFYTFNRNDPPTSASEIDEVTIIYPNVSYQGSGGGLHSGNKVHLGQYPKDTEIGWVLYAQGWSAPNVTEGIYALYSNQDFNPESDPNLRQHTVFLNDIGRELILLGFEDIKRDQSSCDQDFNDAIFYITVSPIQAVDMSDLALVDYTGDDEDGDGIPDNFDDYPTNPDKAFNNYFFTEGTYGTLAFEDMWPGTGDYDFNDLVIDYNFNQVTNADNNAVEIFGEFKLKAFGATFHNGFGIDLGISPALISSVTGYEADAAWVDLNNKGLENGQTNAVVILFDDTYNFMAHTGGIGVNTTPTYPFVEPYVFNLHIVLTEPVPLSSIGVPPYNPFMVVDQQRGHEVHLSDHAPTDLVDNSLFGTFRDDSDPASGRYYKTENNLPWAIKLIETFDYPVEKTEILDAYLRFGAWAESAGTIYNNWYTEDDGMRNASNIYQAP
jgi:LruC domain-containing protein